MTHLSAESLPWIPREFVTTFDENNHRLLDIPLDVAPSTSVSSDRGYLDHDRNKTTIFTSPPIFSFRIISRRATPLARFLVNYANVRQIFP